MGLTKALVESNTTDCQFGENDQEPEYLALYGACEELLWYFRPEDAQFFRDCADQLEEFGRNQAPRVCQLCGVTVQRPNHYCSGCSHRWQPGNNGQWAVPAYEPEKFNTR